MCVVAEKWWERREIASLLFGTEISNLYYYFNENYLFRVFSFLGLQKMQNLKFRYCICFYLLSATKQSIRFLVFTFDSFFFLIGSFWSLLFWH
jgi:hypothetical protein